MQEKTLETKHDFRDKMMKLPFLSGITAQDKQDLGKFIFDIVYEFAREEGRKEGFNEALDTFTNFNPKHVITQYKEELLSKLPKEKQDWQGGGNWNECLSTIKELLI